MRQLRKLFVLFSLGTALAMVLIFTQSLPKNQVEFVVVKRKPVKLVSTQQHFKASLFDNVTLSPSSPSSNLATLSDKVTVVTAYFNIGDFRKGDTGVFGPRLYRQWMTVLSRIRNPLVVYCDTDDDVAFLDVVRSNLPRNLTKVIRVHRDDLWSFGLQPHIQKLYDRPLYPKHLPNTVRADYSCAMHAKYELIRKTINENPFRTKYICWLDIGLFRQLIPPNAAPLLSIDPPFQISLPPGFDVNRVAYSEVFSRDSGLDISEIIRYNAVWVCGCFFIGRVDVIFRWTAEYMAGVERMLELNWMSTDQQVIYWIFNKNASRTRIQIYRNKDDESNWFYLGYLSKVPVESGS